MERYSKQIKILGNVQNKLKKSTVAIVGIGALGSHSAELLVRSGIGKILLVDREYVELTNINSQNLYTEDDLNLPKAIAAKKHLEKINNEIEIVDVVEDINYKNICSILKKPDIIIDGTDNLDTRFLINDYCIKNKIPWIYGSIIGTEGYSFNIIPGYACLRCIFNGIPNYEDLETCETFGLLNTLPSLIASRQVTEAIKLLLNKKYSRKFFKIDIWKDNIELLDVKKNKNCVCCGKKKFEFLDGIKKLTVNKICGSDTFQIKLTKEVVDFKKLYKKLKNSGDILFNEFIFHFIVGKKRLSIFKNGRVIVKGVKNEKEAKILCSKYIG